MPVKLWGCGATEGANVEIRHSRARDLARGATGVVVTRKSGSCIVRVGDKEYDVLIQDLCAAK